MIRDPTKCINATIVHSQDEGLPISIVRRILVFDNQRLQSGQTPPNARLKALWSALDCLWGILRAL